MEADRATHGRDRGRLALPCRGSRRRGGTSLGLAIARRVIEAHSGTIRAVSRPGARGTAFTITLPVATGPTPSGGLTRRA